MSAEFLYTIEVIVNGLLTGVMYSLVALGFGGWQYWSVSREIKRDKDAKRTDRDE